MPQHHPRPVRARLLSPVVLGIVAFIAVGSLSAGTTLTPEPLAPQDAAAGDVLATVTDTPDPTAIPRPTPDTLEPAVAALTIGAPDLHDGSDSKSPGAPAISSLAGYQWPLLKGRLTQPFGPTKFGSRVVDGKPFHDGIDLATFCGDRIVAAHDGVVLAAGRHYDDAIGWLGDLTPYYRRLDAKKLWSTLPIVVVIDDGNGYRSMYAHFQKVVVKPGQFVRAGDVLGKEGRTGNASGCHLHYGLFSPQSLGSIAIEPGVAKRMKLPPAEIARIDPLRVLPPRPSPTTAADTVGR